MRYIAANMLLIACLLCVPSASVAQSRKVRQIDGTDSRFQIRPFRLFLVFDENIRTAMRDRSQLQAILDGFNRDFAKDIKERGNQLVLPDGTLLVPTDGATVFGVDWTPDDVWNKVAELEGLVEPNEILFAYIQCHGEIDPITKREYLLAPAASGGTNRILRSDLRDRLEFQRGGMRSWLTIFVTDACSSFAGPQRPVEDPIEGSIWKSLYFAHRGTIDIPSSSAGTPSFSIGGSLFLEAFRRTFRKTLAELDIGTELVNPRPDGIVQWHEKEYYGALQTALDEVVAEQLRRFGPATPEFMRLTPPEQMVIGDLMAGQTLRPLNPRAFSVSPAQPSRR